MAFVWHGHIYPNLPSYIYKNNVIQALNTLKYLNFTKSYAIVSGTYINFNNLVENVYYVEAELENSTTHNLKYMSEKITYIFEVLTKYMLSNDLILLLRIDFWITKLVLKDYKNTVQTYRNLDFGHCDNLLLGKLKHLKDIKLPLANKIQPETLINNYCKKNKCAYFHHYNLSLIKPKSSLGLRSHDVREWYGYKHNFTHRRYDVGIFIREHKSVVFTKAL